MPKRCDWVTEDELYIRYHDDEWGVPVYDDRKLFEMLVLEGMQAGLSWLTVLRKRENFRKAFSEFDVVKVAAYTDDHIQELLGNSGIIRNRLKIRSVIENAKRFIAIQEQYGSFSGYIWKFVDGAPVINQWNHISEVPASTKESDQMSKALRKLGFNFVGTTICYAFMQATGMVHDHTTDCFRHANNQIESSG